MRESKGQLENSGFIVIGWRAVVSSSQILPFGRRKEDGEWRKN
jgi:hypothetical protein